MATEVQPVPALLPEDDGSGGLARVRRVLGNHQRIWLGLLGAVVVLAAWEISADLKLVNPAFTSKPSSIAIAAKQYFDGGGGLYALKISAIEFAIGFALSLVAGLIIGMAMGWWKWFDYLADPLVNFGYAAPRIALVPLLVVWFGIGTSSKVAVVFLSAVFPIIINTMSGVKTADASLVRVAHSFKATNLQTFRTVALPGAVPSIVTGIRLGIGQGLIGMVVGELIASTAGLGYTIETAGNNFQTSLMFVAVVIVSGIGVLLTQSLRTVERRLDRWRPDARA
jgi:NitT/TauT family transport system permease protein